MLSYVSYTHVYMDPVKYEGDACRINNSRHPCSSAIIWAYTLILSLQTHMDPSFHIFLKKIIGDGVVTHSLVGHHVHSALQHAFIHIRMHIYMYIYTSVCVFVYVCVWEREGERDREVWACVCVCVCVYVCVRVCEGDTRGCLSFLGWVKSDETLGTDVLVRSLY